MQTKLGSNITCFSEIESIASYLGVASAKNVIKDVGFKINAAEAIAYRPSDNSNIKSNNFFSLILAGAIILLCGMTVLVSRRKRKICAPIFKPSSCSLVQSTIYIKFITLIK